jgi:hypothetical protein
LKPLRPRLPKLSAALSAAAFLALSGVSAQAEMKPTLNFNGVAGLLDMPTGESMPDGSLSITSAHFGPISRTTMSFQITPRLSGSFRYMAIRDYDKYVSGPRPTYYDRLFDLRYQLFFEGTYTPGVVIGMQDFIGTGLSSAEYIVATKTFGQRLKVSAGLGWGRLATYQPIGSFGTRPNREGGTGTVHTGQWFRGDIAPFAGIEWQATPKLGVKLEYSSDNYDGEAGHRKTFERNSPFNFGVEYQAAQNLRLGAYYMYGSEVGVSAQFTLDPRKSPTGGPLIPGPRPVAERPARGGLAWSEDWVSDSGRKTALRDSLGGALRSDRIVLETLTLHARDAEVRIRVPNRENAAQIVGRTARAMAGTLPASVETFRIVALRDGLPLSQVVIRRTDLEELDHAGRQDALIWGRTQVLAADGRPEAGALMMPGLYPRFGWGVAPYVRTSLFDPDNPMRIDAGLRLQASYDIAPGLVISGSMSKKLVGNLASSDRVSDSVLPHVRSDSNIYDREGDPSIDSLTAAWYAKPGENLYSRVTVGYLERMFGGVSAELLWKRVDRPYAFGIEINYARQRDFNQLLGFQDYDVITGHVSGYFNLGRGYLAQIDVGRYLAGDVGATLSLDREFPNGWRVGAFATFTDVSFDDFGEGSFDKGIRVTIPFNWLLGRPTEKAYDPVIRPITRDGGARLNVEGRLYDVVRGYHQNGLEDQWGRFWR